MTVNSGATAVFVSIAAVLAVLQGLGTFGPSWIDGLKCDKLDNKPECCKSSPRQCGDTFSLAAVDPGIFNIEIAAFALSAAVFGLFFMAGWCWCSNFRFSDFAWCKPLRCHNFYAVIGGFIIWLYPIAGALSFAGSMMVLTEYEDGPYGYSFYVCMAAGCLMIATSIALFIFVCCKRGQYISEVRSKRYGGAGKQTGGATECAMCVQSLNPVLLVSEVSDFEDDEEGSY